MKIAAVDLCPYALPLARPLPGAAAGVQVREGILIGLREESGAEGWGDVAPLPGFSRESLAAAGDQLFALGPTLPDRLPAFTQQPSWEAALLRPLSTLDLFSSVRFGLECAICNLAAAAWGTPWRLRLAATPLTCVPVNALLTGWREDILREAQAAVAKGYRSLKIKVGSVPVREEIDRVRQVSSVIPRQVTLRLDANRAWSLAEALAFALGIRGCAIEYIEEPVREAGALDEFIRRSGLPVALDESLDAVDPGALPRGLRAIVLKPTVRGGISSALRWARAARQSGVTPVISAAFESAVGLRALAELAAVVHDPDVAAGLDTGRWLAHDMAEPALEVIGGVVNVAAPAVNAARPTGKKMECPLAAAARRNPEGTALRQNRKALSFRELDAVVSQAAARLKVAGCDAGTYVALLMANDWSMVVCLLALLRLGAVACPLNTRNPPQVLRGQLRQLNCRRLIAAPAAAPAEPGIEVLDPAALCAGPGVAGSAPPLESDRPAVALFTSGSTAAPKASLLTLGNLVANARASNEVNELLTQDCWLLSLPLFHVGGLGILFRCLEAGASLAIGGREESLHETLGRYPVTHLSLVPTQLQRLLDERTGQALAARLKCILLGGAAAPDALVREALRAGLPVRKTYGLTEMASQVATVPPAAPADLQLAAGRVLPGCDVKLAEDGELWVRGPTRFAGYIEAGRLVRPFDADGWFATGDLGQFDSDDFLTIVGRKDHLFITGGENVQPEEVEAALCAIEGVTQAVVVPVEDREFGFRPVAFVRLAAGQPDEQDLCRRLQDVLPRYKIPMRFFAWPDTGPGPSLKMARSDFRQRATALLPPGQRPA